jgi:DNA-binding NtrC family response regulator
VRGLTHRAQIRLSRHSWPGNVRGSRTSSDMRS